MAGVGLTWYTWLEQGRDISVSSYFLDRIATVFSLDEIERRHLFLLAQKRPPICRGNVTVENPPVAHLLLNDLKTRPAYLFNLRWDVLAWNPAAQLVFGFEDRHIEERNIFWMLFADERLSRNIDNWEAQSALFVASFRRNFAQAPEDEAMQELVFQLQERSAYFKDLWNSQNVHGRCRGQRTITVNGIGPVLFHHSTITIDQEQNLYLAIYAAEDDEIGKKLAVGTYPEKVESESLSFDRISPHDEHE